MKTHSKKKTRAPQTAFVLVLLTVAVAVANPIPLDHLQMGVDAMNNRDYSTAIEHFQNAVEAEPQSLTAQFHLANAYMTKTKTAPQEERVNLAGLAQKIYESVLAREPSHTLAIWNMAMLTLNRGSMDEAAEWCRKLIELDPSSQVAHYTLGVTRWVQVHQADAKARHEAGMRPGDPGPIGNQVVRDRFREANASLLEEGFQALRTALSINPNDEEAMLYVNLLYRLKADMADTQPEATELLGKADRSVQESLRVKAVRLQGSGEGPARSPAKLDPLLPPPGLPAPPPPPAPPVRRG